MKWKVQNNNESTIQEKQLGKFFLEMQMPETYDSILNGITVCVYVYLFHI